MSAPGGKPAVPAGAAGERLCHTGSEADLLPRAPHGQASAPQPVCSRHHLGTPVLQGRGHSREGGGKTSSQGPVAGRGTDPAARGTVRLFRNIRPLPTVRALVSATWGPAHLLSV